MKQHIKTAALASAGLALLSSTAFAGYNDQDVLLSFRKAGAANDFMVDLGSVSAFTAASSFNLSTVSFNQADLMSAFGNNLNGVLWSAWAGNSASGGTETWLAGSDSAGWNSMPATQIRSVDGQINTYGGVNIGGVTSVAVAGSTTEWLNAPGNPNSFTKFQGTAGKINGKFPQGSTDIGDGVAFGTTGYFTDITANSAAVLGSFTFDATTGSGMWNGAATVPEPSAGLLAGVGLLAMAGRRQFARKSA